MPEPFQPQPSQYPGPGAPPTAYQGPPTTFPQPPVVCRLLYSAALKHFAVRPGPRS